MTDHYKPTANMAANASKGLKLREQFDRGGTEVGVKRAKQLADRHDLSEADVKSMHSYFARHDVDKQAKAHEWGSDKDPSPGYVAWLLWGGDEGKKWADAHADACVRKIDVTTAQLSRSFSIPVATHSPLPAKAARSGLRPASRD